MSPSLILYLLIVGALVALSAAAVDAALRRAAMPTRWVWVAALGAIVAFAVLAPREESGLTPLTMDTEVQFATQAAASSPTYSIAATILRGQQWMGAMLSTAFAAIEAGVPARVATMAAAVWAAASALVLLLLVAVHRRADRARREWPTAELHGTRVRLAPLAGPAVVGVTRPEIVLPRWLLERDADEQRLVIAHEREHVAARDHLLPIGAWLVAAALPWHPAVWWMMSRLRLAMELDCDARVLRSGVQTRTYGLLLIDIAGRYGRHRAGALALADRSSHLERRLQAMTTTKSRFTTVRACALVAVAALSLVAACEARLPTSAEVETMDAASAKEVAVRTQLIGAQLAPTYYVDNEVTAEAIADKISETEIASVTIAKGNAGRSEIRIITNKFAERLAGEVKLAFDSSVMKKTLVRTRSKDGAPFAGIIFVNGVRASSTALESIKPENIKSVEIIKGWEASALSNDPAAANGVIKITTGSRLPSAGAEVEIPKEELARFGAFAVRQSGDSALTKEQIKLAGTRIFSSNKKQFEGLVYIDGVRASNATFESIDPEAIASVDVLKGAAAAAVSTDPAAANGIIQIRTKKGIR